MRQTVGSRVNLNRQSFCNRVRVKDQHRQQKAQTKHSHSNETFAAHSVSLFRYDRERQVIQLGYKDLDSSAPSIATKPRSKPLLTSLFLYGYDDVPSKLIKFIRETGLVWK